MKSIPIHRSLYHPTLLTLLLVFLIVMTVTGCRQEPVQRPNILFAIADDWAWPHAGIYGDPVVQTPAFDRIAREGLLFNHAYVTSPSCTPSRNGILTGQYHWRLGSGANLWSTLDESIPVYPLLLEDAGYVIGHYRKSWGPGDLSNWERHPAGENYNEGGFEAFLDQWSGERPFCFWLGSSDPHRPYEPGSGAAAGINPGRILLYECLPDHDVVRADVADYYYEVQRFDTLVAGAIQLLEERGLLENTLVVVTGDNGMPFPRCKANNYDTGVRMPLAVRWGKRIKKPGRVLDDFVSLTDLAPTFLEAGGTEVPGVMTGKSLMPLFTRSADGKTDPARSYVLHGKERHVPGQEGNLGGYPVRAIRNHDFLYIRNFEPDRWPAGTPNYLEAAIPYCWFGDCDNGPTKSYMVEHREVDGMHRKLYDLAFSKRPAEELYDCRNDPGQLINLAGKTEYEAIQKEMAGLLMKELERTGDPRVVGGAELFDRVPYLGYGPRHPSYQPGDE